MRAILPGMANQTISMIKGTSIASVIFVNELTFRSQQIVGQNFKFFTVFAAAASSICLPDERGRVAQFYLEKYYSLGGLEEAARESHSPWRRRAGKRFKRAGALADRLDGQSPDQRAEGSVPDLPFVICRNVHKSYGEKEILRASTSPSNAAKSSWLMGPSGSGKSTLLRLVNHLEPLDWGEITVDGKYVGYQNQIGGGLNRSGMSPSARADARIGMVLPAFQFVRSSHGARKTSWSADPCVWRINREDAGAGDEFAAHGRPRQPCDHLRTACRAAAATVRSLARLRSRRA